VQAGERALGPALFQQEAGNFWAILETRPYLRARLGLAHSLWTAGRRQEAVEHLHEILRLNPSDNQGVRYTLADFLLFLDRDEDLVRLLGQFADEDSATWAYTKALLAFRQSGDTPQSRKLLRMALRANGHVPDYLLERKFPSAEPPGYYSPGQENEALHYIGGFFAAWRSRAGAIAWLRANDPENRKRQEQTPTPRGPLSMVKNWLKRKLPQEEDVWQADVHPLPNAIRVAGEKMRPWIVLVTSRSRDLVLAHALLEQEPVAASLWDALAQAMQNPAVGEMYQHNLRLAERILADNRIGTIKEKEYKGGRLWVLEECPFCGNSDHSAHVEIQVSGEPCRSRSSASTRKRGWTTPVRRNNMKRMPCDC
jgi:tetratricopeptide (TPR) repeat protein